MMEPLPLDPYEQQLLKVFDSYDHDNLGSLDKHGLTQLCQTLQLEEQGNELIRCLLKDPKCSRATFPEFKEALLALLGSMQNGKVQNEENGTPKKCESGKGSPDREVSPKFVYGSKKYGRRSRPRNDDINCVLTEQNDINSINRNTNNNNNNNNNNNVSVQRSNSQSEVSNSKKRKTNYKLKRCTSLPGNSDLGSGQRNLDSAFITSHSLGSESEFVCTEDMLKEAWEKLGVGKDGYLNQTELILVCDAIGLQKLAKGVLRQLSNKLTLDYNHKISFQELLEALQQDDAWSEVLNSTPTNLEETLSTTHSTESLFPDSRYFQHVSLGPEGSGIVGTDVIVDLWESAGITSPKELLHELGFDCHQINIADLAAVMEKELKGISDSQRLENNPHIALLQATLTLYQSEIRCLKNILEQMAAEREKLKYDVMEANNRATLLAQEVDDNHIRMELNTQNQVKLLEQRHNDILKEVMQQFSSEKEQMALVNQSLERKIACLEQETEKLQKDLVTAQNYTASVEKENQALSTQIGELQQVKDVLTKQIESLENEKQKYTEMEHEQIEPLLSKLSTLQIENAQLRDRIDEMVSEIEGLTNQVSTMRSKVSSTPTFNTLDHSMEDNNVSIICEGVGIGNKRRSDYSPTKDTNLFSITDGSPRLGKVRKFHKNKDNLLDVPFTSSESGFDTEVDCFDSSVSSIQDNCQDEIQRLQTRIAYLEQILVQHAIPIPSGSELDNNASSSAALASAPDVPHLTRRLRELEGLLGEAGANLKGILDQKCLNVEAVHRLSQKLDGALLADGRTTFLPDAVAMDDTDDGTVKGKRAAGAASSSSSTDACTSTDELAHRLEEKIRLYEEENEELTTKCTDLEQCVELLRTEYERCEDYWANKLDEERQMFVQDQTQSNERIAELIGKVTDYEEQLIAQDSVDGRLPPIQETYNLEKQFTDLEKEFEEYKELSSTEISKRDQEITSLTQQLTDLSVGRAVASAEVGVQMDDLTEYARIEDKMRSLSNHVAECTNLYSADTMPVNWEGQEDANGQLVPASSSCTSPSPTPSSGQYNDPAAFVWNGRQHVDGPVDTHDARGLHANSTRSLPVCWAADSPSQPASLTNAGSTSSGSMTLEKGAAPLRPKRTRKHDKNVQVYKKNNHEREAARRGAADQPSSGRSSWKGIEDYKNGPEQIVQVPVSTIHNLNGRLHHLEQKCRHLQMVVKQQHYYAEQTLQYCWQQHKGEKAELQYLLKSNQDRLDQEIRIRNDQLEKLTRSDMLVKELYVENSYLIATVQRLQQRCDMLTQCNANSSV